MTSVQSAFEETGRHLLEDEAPSIFLSALTERPAFRTHPFSMLARLMETPQSPKYHPEGNVWNHTLLVVDAAASVKDKSSDSQSFIWAALLHDIGKPDTTRILKGKITSYRHEAHGAVLAGQFLGVFHCDAQMVSQVVSLVKWHMQILFVSKSLPFANISAMKQEADLNDVALLGLCDRLGRLGADQNEELQTYRSFLNSVINDAKTK